MKKSETYLAISLLIFLSVVFLPLRILAINQLNVHDPQVYGSKLGYIDKATLYVEPHGAYVEQTLFLDYSDHSQFSADRKIEIVHMFELPQGSVVNDLWLWISGTPIRAQMIETWKAQVIYDSIVSKHRDPAFLSKRGNQYELRIYPLTPGSYRRIKVVFITPTKWFGQNGVAELPLRMLAANNASVKPLKVFFKVAQNVWGAPSIVESPLMNFTPQPDSGGYSYKSLDVGNIGTFSSLSLGFQTVFENGSFFSSVVGKTDTATFQLGFVPPEIFTTISDTSARKYFVGIDLSGFQNKDYSILMPNLKSVLKSALRSKDRFKVIVAGAGKMQVLSSDWSYAVPESIDQVFDRFVESDFANDISKLMLPTVIYADANARICWQFPGVEKLCIIKNFGSLKSSLDAISSASIVAAYNQGFEHATETKQILNDVVSRLDTFFLKGGRLLTYFDHNRQGGEVLARHYIEGLNMQQRADVSTTLYRNLGGNIGAYFPESLVHFGFDYLLFTDRTTRIDVQDISGRAAVISKKISNGLLVVSSIWSFIDDGATKALLGVPLLGLSAVTQQQQLTDLLNGLREQYTTEAFDKALVFSNTDSAFSKSDAASWATQYLGKFVQSPPVFCSINLLDGTTYTPAYVSEDGMDYYGGGYLLKKIASATQGIHFESHIDNWNYISASLSHSSVPVIDSLRITVAMDDTAGRLIQMREVNPVKNDPNKPRFFIGAGIGHDKIRFDIEATFVGKSKADTTQLNCFLQHDTTKSENLVPSLLANENIKDLLAQPPYDTVKIVSLALRYNLLCNFTALLALEPKDTTGHVDPNDPKEPPSSVDSWQTSDSKDTLSLEVYPNPFNSQVALLVNVKSISEVSLAIYNVLGQLVREMLNNEVVDQQRVLYWNGTDDKGRTVSTGTYFVRMVAKDLRTKQSTMELKRILFVK